MENKQNESPFPEWYLNGFEKLRKEQGHLTKSERKVITYIARRMDRAVPMSELSKFMNPATVSVAVKNLEKAGILKKFSVKSRGRGRYSVRLVALPKELGYSHLRKLPFGTEIDMDSAFFMENLRMIQPIIDTLEVDEKRELEEVKLHFLIDFSEVHDLLHPDLSVYHSLGWVLNMFEKKIVSDNYIFTPPSAYEMLSHMEKTARATKKYSDFRQVLKNKKFVRFLKVLSSSSQSGEITYKRLLDAYSGMGPLRELIILADNKVLKELFPCTIKRLGELVQEKVIIPLDSVLGDVSESNINLEVYQKVLNYLGFYRFSFDQDKRNVVDALNIALTYSLTDKRYKHEDEYFAFVTHSKMPLMIFESIIWENDPFGIHPLVRTPLFMSTRSYYRNEIADPQKRIAHLNSGKEVLKYLWEHRDLLSYYDKFSEAFQKGGMELIKEDLVPVAEMLKQVSSYKKNFSYHVQNILAINRKTIGRVRKRAPEGIIAIIENILRDREVYEDRMSKAHETIVESMRESYRVLRNFVDVRFKDLLTPKMVEWLNQFEQY